MRSPTYSPAPLPSAESAMNVARVRPVILCGGAGTRLWPVSRRSRPKQMLPLTGEMTLLQLTALRAQQPGFSERPLLVTSEAIAKAAAAQLEAIGISPDIVVEPQARNTAPAIALAAHECRDDEILVVMSSDHVIADNEAFVRAIALAVTLAAEGWLVTIGLQPTRAETGYGYIRAGASLGDGAAEVLSFVEKPDAQTAQAYLESGDYLWNGGIFVFRKGVFLDALRAHAPQVHALAAAASAEAVREGGFLFPAPASFAEMPSISVDHALLERAERIAVVAVDMGWSDIGNWDALNALVAADENGNRLHGNVLVQGARHCAIRSDGPRVVAIGVENLTIIATPDAMLIMPAGESDRLAEALRALQARNCPTLD